MAKHTQKQLNIVNTFGVFCYISMLVQWMWIVAVFLPALLENETFKSLFLPSGGSEQTPIVSTSSAPSGLTIVIGLAVTVVVLVITIVILIRLPSTIAKSGAKITHETARVVRPVVTHHQPLAPKKQRLIDTKLVLYIKLVIATVPLLLLVFLPLVSLKLEKDVVVLLSAALEGATMLWLCLQYGLSKLFKLPIEKLI